MSWLQQLADELTARGVGGRDRRGILDELRDHIACEHGSVDRLGDPRELAGSFADELATSRIRRAALWTFGALAAAALVLAVSQVAINHAGGYPGFDHGLSQLLFWPALLGVTVAPQAALVAGTLAALRAVRRRRTASLPAAELALVARRSRVALAAGLATMAGLGIYVVNFVTHFPVWYEVVVAGLAAVAAVGLVIAWRTVARAGSVVCGAEGPAGDVFDDLPMIRWDWLRRHPWLLGALASVLAAGVITAGTGHAEHSLIEGLQRGIPEGLAAAIGFIVLGRAIGVAGPAPAQDPYPPTDA
jgi:hypothetical protein